MKIQDGNIPKRFVNGRGWSVIVAERGREYGGAEEGGWWVDTYDVRYIEYGGGMSEATARARMAELAEGRFKATGRPLSSVNYCGGTYSVWVLPPGEAQPSFEPTEWPRYE